MQTKRTKSKEESRIVEGSFIDSQILLREEGGENYRMYEFSKLENGVSYYTPAGNKLERGDSSVMVNGKRSVNLTKSSSGSKSNTGNKLFIRVPSSRYGRKPKLLRRRSTNDFHNQRGKRREKSLRSKYKIRKNHRRSSIGSKEASGTSGGGRRKVNYSSEPEYSSNEPSSRRRTKKKVTHWKMRKWRSKKGSTTPRSPKGGVGYERRYGSKNKFGGPGKHGCASAPSTPRNNKRELPKSPKFSNKASPKTGLTIKVENLSIPEKTAKLLMEKEVAPVLPVKEKEPALKGKELEVGNKENLEKEEKKENELKAVEEKEEVETAKVVNATEKRVDKSEKEKGIEKKVEKPEKKSKAETNVGGKGVNLENSEEAKPEKRKETCSNRPEETKKDEIEQSSTELTPPPQLVLSPLVENVSTPKKVYSPLRNNFQAERVRRKIQQEMEERIRSSFMREKESMSNRIKRLETKNSFLRKEKKVLRNQIVSEKEYFEKIMKSKENRLNEFFKRNESLHKRLTKAEETNMGVRRRLATQQEEYNRVLHEKNKEIQEARARLSAAREENVNGRRRLQEVEQEARERENELENSLANKDEENAKLKEELERLEKIHSDMETQLQQQNMETQAWRIKFEESEKSKKKTKCF